MRVTCEQLKPWFKSFPEFVWKQCGDREKYMEETKAQNRLFEEVY